jgi:DHA3 family tetracycline resistance protein-like MFS transporter
VIADVYSRRLSCIIGFVLVGLGFMIEGTQPHFAAVLLAQFVWGFGWTFVSGAWSAWIADEVGQEAVASVYLRGTQFDQLGSLIGIPISVLLGRIALFLPIVTGGLLSLGLATFLLLVMPEENFRPTPPDERDNWGLVFKTVREGIGLGKKSPTVLTFLIIGLFLGLSSEGYDRLWTAHILENFHFPSIGHLDTETWFGIMRAGSMIMTLGTTEIVKRRLAGFGASQLPTILQGLNSLMVFSVLLLASTGQINLAIVAYWLFGAMRATAEPLSTAWVNQHIDSEVRATVLSMISQVDAIGQVVGGPIVGLVGTLRSLRWALAASAGILSPVIPLYGWLRRLENLEQDT